jgi:hypothetical protein
MLKIICSYQNDKNEKVESNENIQTVILCEHEVWYPNLS